MKQVGGNMILKITLAPLKSSEVLHSSLGLLYLSLSHSFIQWCTVLVTDVKL